MFIPSKKPAKISFLRFYSPLIIIYISFAIACEGTGLYYLIKDQDWQAIFLILLGAPFIPLLITSLKVWDYKDWNYVLVYNHYIVSYSLRGKKMFELDTEKTVYYAELVVPDTISRSQIVYVLSNDTIPLSSSVDFRKELCPTSQLLVIANTKSARFIPRNNWIHLKPENGERVWL